MEFPVAAKTKVKIIFRRAYTSQKTYISLIVKRDRLECFRFMPVQTVSGDLYKEKAEKGTFAAFSAENINFCRIRLCGILKMDCGVSENPIFIFLCR